MEILPPFRPALSSTLYVQHDNGIGRKSVCCVKDQIRVPTEGRLEKELVNQERFPKPVPFERSSTLEEVLPLPVRVSSLHPWTLEEMRRRRSARCQ